MAPVPYTPEIPDSVSLETEENRDAKRKKKCC